MWAWKAGKVFLLKISYLIHSTVHPRPGLGSKANPDIQILTLSITPEPFGCAQGLELVERHSPGMRSGSRRGDS